MKSTKSLKLKKPKIVKRMISLTVELDKWVKLAGKQKPFKTSSSYVRAVLMADYDNFKARLSKNPSTPKK
jgi:hypothetical protein